MSETDGLARLGRLMVTGAAWTVGLRVVIRLLGIVSMVVLARLLTPADFGLVALGSVVAAALQLLGAFNFDVWLIRHPNPDRSHYDTVWTLSIIRDIAIALLLVALAAPLAAWYEEPRLATLLMVLAAVTVVSGLRNVGVVDFVKHLQFDKDFLLMAAPRLGAFLVTVGLALWLRDYRALVGGLAANAVLGLLASYAMHRFRPVLSLEHWRETFAFSKWLLAANMLGFIYQRADTFILGKMLGSASLGLYSIAHEISNLASTELVTPLRRVMLPGYSKMSADRPMLQRAFVDGFALIVAIGVPCAVGLAAVARPLVQVFLGEQWLETIPVIQILALYSVCAVAVANQTPVLLVLGHIRTTTALVAFGVACLVPVFTWATDRHGIHGAAVALGVTHLVVMLVSLAITLRRLALPARTLLRRVWRAVLATAVMALAVTGSLDATHGWWPAASLAVGVATGVLTYAALLLALWRACGSPDGPEQLACDYLRRSHRGRYDPAGSET